MIDCPFCPEIIGGKLPDERIFAFSADFNAIYDGFPISHGHTLIIPKRHIQFFNDLNRAESADLVEMIHYVKEILDDEFKPDAYNIGINDGPAAGQTMPHLHVHIIPRYKGDVYDPRGGVRWIIPTKADYWT